jgi:LAS superfamily LD-carboxypeptidase LdcB
MNRNQFIKLTGLTGIALATFPHLAFNSISLSYDELIGKGNPELFGVGYKLRKEAHEAFLKMKSEAQKSDISLKVVSSYRDFKHQKTIWERKFKRYKSQGLTAETTIQKIIEYSTIPGTSRHHWGTDIDIVDANAKQPANLLNPANFEDDACFGPFKKWMDTCANEFGFYLVYTNVTDRKGFKYEPWHYSYKPLSFHYLSEYRQLNFSEIFQKDRIMGSDNFTDDFINDYMSQNILDINPDLL